MRIALVSESFYPAVDGTTTTVRAVADRLVDTGALATTLANLDVRPMETGLLHDPRDPRGLVRALDTVVADRQRGLLGEHGRMLAEWRSWEDAVDELVTDHYLPLVATSRAA